MNVSGNLQRWYRHETQVTEYRISCGSVERLLSHVADFIKTHLFRNHGHAIALLGETRGSHRDEITAALRDNRFRLTIGTFQMVDVTDHVALLHMFIKLDADFKPEWISITTSLSGNSTFVRKCAIWLVALPSGSPGNARFMFIPSSGDSRVAARAAGKLSDGIRMIRSDLDIRPRDCRRESTPSGQCHSQRS